MTATTWANVALAIPFLLAFIAIPLWMTFRRPNTATDHSQAHSYLRAKAAFAAPSRVSSGVQHEHRAAA